MKNDNRVECAEGDVFGGGTKLPLVEDFYTIQGEGYNTGKAAYFIRLGGCDVGCKWCDAKFTWNAALFPPVSVEEIAARAVACKAHSIVITGGEPLMYPLEMLTGMLKREGLEVFLETSGTHSVRGYFDWICLSPKKQMPPLREVCHMADELKVIIESAEDFLWAEQCASNVGSKCRLYLQPEWSRYADVIGEIVEYAKANPQWSVSLQTHKFMHIP